MLLVKGVRFAKVIGDKEIEQAILIGITGGDSHASLGRTIPIKGQPHDGCVLIKELRFIFLLRSPFEKCVGHGIVRNEQVKLLVSLKVGGYDPQSIAMCG